MKQLLRKILKYLAYLGAALVILLAVAVGLFRLLLPKLPAYQEEIKEWANAAVGMQVEFSGMDARWRLSGPELTFYDAELATPGGNAPVLRADEVSVGVGLLRLLLDLDLVADRILIRDASVDVVQQADGSWRVQGLPVDSFMDSSLASSGERGSLVVVGEEIDVAVQLAHRQEPLYVGIESLRYESEERQHSIDASLVLPDALGAQLELSASQRLDSAAASPWRLFLEGRALNAAGLSRLWPGAGPALTSGMADLDLWVEVAEARVQSATANFVLTDFAVRNVTDGAAKDPGAPFSAAGRVEYSQDAGGWLLAANEFAMTTVGGEWPESAIALRVASKPSGGVERLKGSATYVDFDDLRYVMALLPEKYRAALGELALSGVVRDLDVTVIDPASESRSVSGSAVMERAGIAAWQGLPGIRGVTGSIRADPSGGRLELVAADMEFSYPEWFAEPIEVAEATGTIVWRRGDLGTTVLSDSVHLQTADFDSQSSLQVTLPANGDSPVIDLQSRWRAGDISVIERYLPVNKVKPGLYRWLRDALVAGQVTTATTRFAGSLEAFPFEDGEGTFRTEAHVENAVLRYAGSWPDVDNMDVDLVIDKARLYSVENSATSMGNRVVDARVEIPDLRSPVLEIDAFATGTLDSIRNFSMQSPISPLFGGHLDLVEVDGEASFRLRLAYPILQKQNYSFSTALTSENGSILIDGMPAPITGIRGKVTVTRDTLDAEGLVGRFLGSPITIELARAGEETPSYSVIATAHGTVDAAGLIYGLHAPIGDLLAGATTYDATVRFPKAGLDEPVPFQIDIESDLKGMALLMPEPIGKPAATLGPLSFAITFPGEGKIQSSGKLSETTRWTLDFIRKEAGWDFDRGVLALGGDAPGAPGTRGLHIEGFTPVLDFDEWLALADRDAKGPGFGDRIRSVDLVVDELTVIGQQLSRHHVVVDRSSLDWAVQIDGAEAVGSITVPYDFASGRPLELEMQKLTLPGGDENAHEPGPGRDPRTLPPISVHADGFTLGNRHLGSLQAEFLSTDRGLEANGIETRSATFSISGSGGWVVDEADPTGQRSYVTAGLTSSNVQQTMQQLDYQPGIGSEDMELKFDVSWSGGPRQDFLASLDGTVGVRLGSGQLKEVEPGAGRVFGLMSIVALPRRLSLDFSDVFERGFGFDEITGTFRLDDGQAYTCDLSLKGPAADVGIVGRTGLVNKAYQQAAVVSANVGNTLPVVGAVVAGPQVAAALLIFSQIFKKPLQEMGQIYYGIDGTWEEPVVDVVDAQRFAAASELAGCLENAG